MLRNACSSDAPELPGLRRPSFARLPWTRFTCCGYRSPRKVLCFNSLESIQRQICRPGGCSPTRRRVNLASLSNSLDICSIIGHQVTGIQENTRYCEYWHQNLYCPSIVAWTQTLSLSPGPKSSPTRKRRYQTRSMPSNRSSLPQHLELTCGNGKKPLLNEPLLSGSL